MNACPALLRAAAGAGLAAAASLAAASQSPLEPHSLQAAHTATLAWVLFGGGAVILVAVLVIMLCALRASDPRPRWLNERSLIIGGGVVFPVIVLSALLIYTLLVGNRLTLSDSGPPLRLEVTGEMWWWRVHYLDADGTRRLVTANEIHVPAGRPVEIALTTADVIHSFWVPGLSGMLDMIPGRVNTLRFTADKPGVLRGQCAEYCGTQHAKMAFDVRVHAPEAFDHWFTAQLEPARAPASEAQARGARLFLAHCAACHTVRGTAAVGTFGPDLTHAGSRLTIAGGALPNNAGTLAGWIASSQHVKPGNKMPSFEHFTGDELTALAAYVKHLQ